MGRVIRATLLAIGLLVLAVPAQAACGDPPAPGVDWRRCDFSGRNLAGADLRQARLYDANLRDADLTGARIDQADLLGAQLGGARWIDGTTICGEGSVSTCE